MLHRFFKHDFSILPHHHRCGRKLFLTHLPYTYYYEPQIAVIAFDRIGTKRQKR